jgi:hypothetical protein
MEIYVLVPLSRCSRVYLLWILIPFCCHLYAFLCNTLKTTRGGDEENCRSAVEKETNENMGTFEVFNPNNFVKFRHHALVRMECQTIFMHK